MPIRGGKSKINENKFVKVVDFIKVDLLLFISLGHLRVDQDVIGLNIVVDEAKFVKLFYSLELK
jgi:hypothetical protein